MAKLETLRVFVTVARRGNLRDAAEELGRTQSALSMALKQLEDDLGGPLFQTDRKRNLTDLGRFVRDVADDLVRDHDRAIALIRGYARGEAGQLRIASVPSVAALILPEVMRTFMADHAGAQMDLMDTDSTNVRNMVESGHADLGIAGPASAGQSLRAQPLFNDRLYVVCRNDSEFANPTRPLEWRHLDGAPLIVNETLSVVKTPDAARIVAQSRLSVRNILSLLAMVESGVGITVLPGLATRTLAPTLRTVPLEGADTVRAISLLSRGGRTESPLTGAFRRHLNAAMPDISRRLNLVPGA